MQIHGIHRIQHEDKLLSRDEARMVKPVQVESMEATPKRHIPSARSPLSGLPARLHIPELTLFQILDLAYPDFLASLFRRSFDPSEAPMILPSLLVL